MTKLQELFKRKPYLLWYVANKNNVSEESLLEHVLNYGDWDDYKKTEKIIGINKVSDSFKKMLGKRRVNLRPQTINFFENYFHKYA